jgi:hypothetical protein
MKVAWHEVPGNAGTNDPSRRARCDSVTARDIVITSLVARQETQPKPTMEGTQHRLLATFCENSRNVTNHAVPYGTDRVRARIPGNKLPGYVHSIPPGCPFRPLAVSPIRLFAVTLHTPRTQTSFSSVAFQSDIECYLLLLNPTLQFVSTALVR